MKQFFKGTIYLLLSLLALWLSCASFAFLVAFSYTDHVLSWIPYIILGGWVPGKWYGLTLLHSIICVSISFGIISFFDNKLDLGDKTRMVLLFIIIALFLYETISNFFFHESQPIDIEKFRQYALLQLSFIIGILIKALNKEAEMN
jgi:hypothetical protein